MRRTLALLLALAMVVSLAACGNEPVSTEPPQTQAPVETNPPATLPNVTVENSATYLQLSISYADGDYRLLSAYDDGAGMAYVEYVGEEKKVASFDLSVLHYFTAALEETGLAALDGTQVTGNGSDYGSMYVAFGDESYMTADYSGKVSQEFLDAYQAMEAYFKALMADVPVYVPQPQMIGEVNEDALAEIMAVLEGSGLEALDTFYISDGETLAVEGVTNVTTCGPAMMTTAYSFVVATVEGEKDINAVRAYFAENMNWNQWVCVRANSATIAQKGNMVLCLMGSGDLYGQSLLGIRNAGWTELETFEDPGV